MTAIKVRGGVTITMHHLVLFVALGTISKPLPEHLRGLDLHIV